MLRLTTIAVLSVLLMAQMPTAPVVTVTPEEKATIIESLRKLQDQLNAVNPKTSKIDDPSAGMRARDVAHQVQNSDEIPATALPFVGMALSRNSQDPKACALMKKIEPLAHGPTLGGACP